MSDGEYLDFIVKETNKNVHKRKLEGEELQYFLYKSHKRLSRMRSGESLADVIATPKNITRYTPKSSIPSMLEAKANEMSLDVMKSILQKQYKSKNLDIEFHLDKNRMYNPGSGAEDEELVKSFNTMENLYNYLTGNVFDPRQEFYKEKDIENFFKLKYKLISQYLSK
jgi:hypothetical protein